jgi:hypothetical protein
MIREELAEYPGIQPGGSIVRQGVGKGLKGSLGDAQ